MKADRERWELEWLSKIDGEWFTFPAVQYVSEEVARLAADMLGRGRGARWHFYRVRRVA